MPCQYLLFILILFGLIPVFVASPIAKCRYCKNCAQLTNSTKRLDPTGNNQTDPSNEDETATLINSILSQDELVNISTRERHFLTRSKRQSFVERRPCPVSFQWGILLIPTAILAIPLVLLCFLLFACFCGKKEERARIPKVWYMKRVRRRLDTADDLYFGEDYVKRKDSQKTRFNTTVTIIERRRESAITVRSLDTATKISSTKNDQQTTSV